MANSPRIFIKEVMEVLGCSRNHVYKLSNTGRLTKCKDGRKTYWLRAEVEAYANGGSRGW